MSDAISGILSGGVAPNASGAGKQLQQNQTGGRSFESVLQQPDGEQAGASSSVGQPAGVSGAQLERMRLDLMQRIDRLPADSSKINTLLPEFIDTRTRMGLLKEAMNGVGQKPTGTDLTGRFGQVENEWKQLESIMRSDKDLSTGELLGLQARLYQVSQHVEVMSKVVDQVTGGVKTILNTNV